MSEQKDFISKRIQDGYNYLDTYRSGTIQENAFWYLNKKVRKEADYLAQLNFEQGKYDKSSEQHMYIKREKEKVAKVFMNIKDQTNKLEQGTINLKNTLTNGMNAGTKAEDLYANTSVYGGQSKAIHIDNDGIFHFALDTIEVSDKRTEEAFANFVETGELDESIGKVVTLKEMSGRSIIEEPYIVKSFVLNQAEKTKNDRELGKSFDENSMYNSSLNNFAEAGPKGVVGAAFTDLSGDGQTKSFAEMYEEGMNPEYYINPDTGQALPAGSEWMKDIANASLLSKLLAKYITNVMKDTYGPTIDLKTGQIKKSTSELAQDLIKKYRK